VGGVGFVSSSQDFTVSDDGFASVIAGVPEPGSTALLLSGLIMLACSVRPEQQRQTLMHT